MEKYKEQLGRYIERLIELRNGVAQTLMLELNNPMFDEMNSQMNTASELAGSNEDVTGEVRKLIFGYRK